MASRQKSSFSPFWILVFIGLGACGLYYKSQWENKILKQIIQRLEADSRAAEVVVTDVKKDGLDRDVTTIKFIEYASDGRSLEPKFFTFHGNLIQFQSLVIRFDDVKIRNADAVKGKSAYLFWKAFHLAGSATEEYEINPVDEVPAAYKIAEEPDNAPVLNLTDVVKDESLKTYQQYANRQLHRVLSVSRFEKSLWKKFWDYALDETQAKEGDVKNAQIEAPGTRFLPGYLYTIKIEHDGGLRIDAVKIPEILQK